MAHSGVQVNPMCIKEFEQMKLRQTYKYIIFRLSPDLQKIEIENRVPHARVLDSEDTSAYEQFLEALPKSAPRYAVYDLHYQLKESGQRNKIFFLLWLVFNHLSILVLVCPFRSLPGSTHLFIIF